MSASPRNRHETRAARDQAIRDRVWEIVAAAEIPERLWVDWLAEKLPGIQPPRWQAAPVDLRQRFARDVLSTGAAVAVTTPPGAVEKCGAFSPETDRPPFRTLARFPRGDTPLRPKDPDAAQT